MRKEMGNQNTSGIEVEERVANEAQEDNQTLTIQENETKKFLENSTDNDSLDASQSSKLQSSEKEEVLINGTVTEEKVDLPDISNHHEKPNDLNPEGGLPNSDNGVHNQESSLNGETPKNDFNSETDSISSPHEAFNNTSETLPEHNMLMKEVEETLESSKIGQVEENLELVKTNVEQNLSVSLIIQTDVKNSLEATGTTFDEAALLEPSTQNKDSNMKSNLVVTGTTSDEAALLEPSTQNKDSAMEISSDDTKTGNGNEGNVYPLDDENESCFKDSNQFISISSLDSTDVRDESLNKSLDWNEVYHQLAIESNLSKDKDEPVLSMDSFARSHSIKSIQEENKIELDQTEQEEGDSISDLESNISSSEKHESPHSQSSEQKDHGIFCVNTEAEIQNYEAYIPQVMEYKGDENGERLNIGVELEKSPSFEFGLPFDTIMLECSDKTPLLYQDRTAIRRYSSCSNIRFSNSKYIENEYYGKALELECEEKTIRMEGSKSEKSKNKEDKTINVNSTSDTANNKKQPKANGKKKTRSSLFTTCICCSAEVIG